MLLLHTLHVILPEPVKWYDRSDAFSKLIHNYAVFHPPVGLDTNNFKVNMMVRRACVPTRISIVIGSQCHNGTGVSTVLLVLPPICNEADLTQATVMAVDGRAMPREMLRLRRKMATVKTSSVDCEKTTTVL